MASTHFRKRNSVNSSVPKELFGQETARLHEDSSLKQFLLDGKEKHDTASSDLIKREDAIHLKPCVPSRKDCGLEHEEIEELATSAFSST
uniref:Centromere protein U n=1 Tax=Angiostrongylus cantonensis TaxID=6313 RepID=A0A0K0D656_ANGCA